MPSAQLREEYSHIIHLRSEPARVLLICRLKQGPVDVASLIEATGFSQASISCPFGQLQRASLVHCRRAGVRTIWSAAGELVANLWGRVQTRVKQRLESLLQQLQKARRRNCPRQGTHRRPRA